MGKYNDNRRTNIPGKNTRKDAVNKVNNGVFVYYRYIYP